MQAQFEGRTATHAEAFSKSEIQIGKQYRWDYPEEFTSLDEYSSHRGQVVTVLRPCTEDEADVIWDDPDGTGKEIIVDRMFLVRCPDGWEGCAWESELADTNSELS